jgi:drug/metabolite transporter (DMT)-like permease
MGYLFLAIALTAGITKGYCGKKTSGAIVSNSDSMIMNVLRMAACIVIGFFLILLQNDLPSLILTKNLLLLSALSGIGTAFFVVSWLLSIRSGAYMMVEIFLLCGVVIPIVACYLFFGDKVGVWQIVGILILLVAIYFMCTYNTALKGKMSAKAFLLLLLCGFANGVTDFSQKLFTKIAPQGATNASFNFYTYIFATITLLVTYLIIRKTDEKSGSKPRRPIDVVRPIWYYVLIMAVCLFANSFFKTEAAKYLDAVQLYPLNQGCAVLLSLLMSAVLFKEKINTKCIVGIFLSFVALLMINLL